VRFWGKAMVAAGETAAASGTEPLTPAPPDTLVTGVFSSSCHVRHDSGDVTSSPIPVSHGLHPELGGERREPDRRAGLPSPAVIEQVCPGSGHLVTVVGVASASECLHSLTAVETSAEVLLSARVGKRPGSGRSDVFDHVARRVLWVVDVVLDLPLGRRAVAVTLSPSSEANAFPLVLHPAPVGQ
jgi:hypothetical protein